VRRGESTAAPRPSGLRAAAAQPKPPAPRFRMSILTDYAGVVSETVTDERLPPPPDTGEYIGDDNLEFRSLLNFEKVGRGEAKRCVMCGRVAEAEDRHARPSKRVPLRSFLREDDDAPKIVRLSPELSAPDRRKAGCEPQTCVIPRQCKDVCDACTKSTWHHRASGAYFKWCQGCKKFRAIAAFANKRHTAKCDACRKRGRSGYHAKVKRQAIDSDSAEMPL